MNGTRDWGVPADVPPEGQITAGRKTYAMVSSLSAGHSLASELVESNDGHEEIIKVYLKGRAGDKRVHEKNIDQLKSEVQYIQEARSCLQKLREDISSKLEQGPGEPSWQDVQVVLEKPNGFSRSPPRLYSPPEPQVDASVHEDVQSLRKNVQDLLAKLQEAERKHQSDRVAFEVTLSRYQREVEQSHAALRSTEARAEQKEEAAGQLQGRLLAMETEHQALLAKLREQEVSLEELRSRDASCQAEQEKAAGLEKEVAGLREKIHHLDDMLKSQQRKVRQMIEQLQNSKAVIQSRDSTIQELREKIAYLEAENLEMHDCMEHLRERQTSPSGFSTQTRAKTENLGSVRISKPPSPKLLPLIRVVET